MQIERIIWLEDIVEKLESKHGVQQDEVREALFGRPLFKRARRGKRRGQDVYQALGQTEDGRHLIIIFILKPGNRALVLSARDMDDGERRQFKKVKG
ncbi:MAG: BrnT family toxin [Chloroflexi bacterium]|nr:BrnT family toxin [Chloroflexota bacterium]MBI3764216.1 BrnT family toxin [Chloroflexota bacterium]